MAGSKENVVSGAVTLPLRALQQFGKAVGVTVLQQVAGLLPAEDVEGRHAPGGARIIALAHQKFEEERRHVEAPGRPAIGENSAEQPPGTGATEEMALVRRLVVGIARRKHHALDAERHGFVEEGAHALGIGAVEQGGVGGDAKAAVNSFLNSRHRQLVTAFLANRKIVVFALAVHVYRKG